MEAFETVDVSEVLAEKRGNKRRPRLSLQDITLALQAEQYEMISEDDYQRWMIQLLKDNGWQVHHDRPARKANGEWYTPVEGDNGYPDITASRNGYTMWLEVKSQHGKPTEAQNKWIDAIFYNVAVIRPSDWKSVEYIAEHGI